MYEMSDLQIHKRRQITANSDIKKCLITRAPQCQWPLSTETLHFGADPNERHHVPAEGPPGPRPADADGPRMGGVLPPVLFPLLAHLLTNIDPKDPVAMEETRMRAATVLSKVFLHHLTPLLSLPTFSNLWLIILDFTDKYMHADKSDLLYEAIPESLKNMLLVMDSARVFDGIDGKGPLWVATWDRINMFLPGMKEELFREINQDREKHAEVAQPAPANTNVEVVQHNIENATRSIILQPPSTQQQVSSHLFAHLGQVRVMLPTGGTSS
jgi:hypothetical protein